MAFGMLAFDGIEELDLIGPWEMVGMWKRVGGPEALIVSEQVQTIRGANGLSISPHVDFRHCPPLEYLLVPGGVGTREQVENASVIDFIQRAGRECRAVLSVCTGAFLLQRAGLLSGRKATTHWNSLDRMRATGDVEVVEERFVRDGVVWTAAGVSAGIDLILAFIAEVAGDEIAGKVQFGAEYYPDGRRYGSAHLSDRAPAYLRPDPGNR